MTVIARSSIGVAVRKGAPKPDIATILRPEQTPLYRLVQQHYETFAATVAHAISQPASTAI